MSITIQEIKALLKSGEILPTYDDVDASGVLTASTGKGVEYTFHHGWDIAKAHACDTQWGVFNVELLMFIEQRYTDPDERNAVLDGTQLEDHHWEWLNKSVCMKSAEYLWFFIMAEGAPQAACVIYQPKPSACEKGNIFYIEFVAVAPWNRINPMSARRFSGVGTRIIRHAVHFSMKTLGLKPGFALHALPKAIPYYEKIGMLPFSSLNKENLPYYEMPEKALMNFMDAA